MLSTIWVNVVTQVVAPQTHYEVTYILTIHTSDHKVFCLMHFKTVALVGRYQDSGLETHLHSLAEMLQNAGCTVIIEEETARFISFPGFQQLSYQEMGQVIDLRSEEHTSELQSRGHLVCRLLLEKKKTKK